MSSESSMSSGSRIREFGLYRTIDARTEEFLRLSRRRQIRQGCACAAVSTAITVTVVVVVFIVYEFSLNSEINLDNSLKSNWFNLMNVTSDGHFESSFKKNVDPTTLQLLPMLIKALKKNVILEKVLEEQSSSSPLTDKKYTADDDYYNNQDFTRNWFKLPASKLYTIEYKSSPVVYFRSPTKSVELFTKVRKVRDYQRILNYIDKMINEKVYVGSTRPIGKGEVYAYTQRPLVKSKFKHSKGSNSKKAYRKNISDLSANYNLKNQDKNDGSCKCPKNISMLLKNFLNSIQKVLPLPSSKVTPDNDNNDVIFRKQKTLESKNINKGMTPVSDIFETTTEELESEEHNITNIFTIRSELISPNIIKGYTYKTTQLSLNDTTTEDDYLVYNEPLKSSDDKGKKEQNVKSTTVNNVVEGTYLEDVLYPTTTKPIKTKSTKIQEKIALESTKVVFDKYSVESFRTSGRPKKTVGLSMNDTEYDDKSYSTTSKDPESDFVNKIKSIKTKTPVDKRFTNNRKKKSEKSLELINYDDDDSSRFLRNLNVDLYNLIEQNARLLNSEMTTSKAPSFANKQTETQTINSVTRESVQHSLNTTFPSENFEIENTDELDVKLLTSFHDLNLTTVTEKTDISWENVNVEPVPSFKSMIPVDRPVYLEFHRNDWKQEEPNDFDYVNNNIYDMLN